MDKLISDRLNGIQKTLIAVYEASNELKRQTTVKGDEREIFVASFLREMFPPQFRFGSGVVIDQHKKRTGQLDVVIELPFAPSFSLGQGSPRIYFADTVGAVIEVKSNLNAKERRRIELQLKYRENDSNLHALKDIRRSVQLRGERKARDIATSKGAIGNQNKKKYGVSNTIPAYIVGYTGPERRTLKKYVDKQRKEWTDELHFDSWFRGILQVDGPFFFGSDGSSHKGPQAIGAFINSLYFELNRVVWGHAQLGRYFDLVSGTSGER